MNFKAVRDYLGDGTYVQRELTRRCIHKLTFRADDVVLDVGCGTGEETKDIAQLVQSVTGTTTVINMRTQIFRWLKVCSFICNTKVAWYNCV